MHYSYDKSRQLCAEQGLVFDERVIQSIDPHFKLHKFTQTQVDAALQAHIYEVKRLFTPKNYSLGQRIKIALYFLLG